MLLAGEPGIGKTRLATEFAREAHADGATVLYGRSDPESLVPYQPFITAVQHYIAHRETLDLPAELEPELRELARFVPALRRQLPTLREPIAEDARDPPLPAVRGGHARCSPSPRASTPTVLVLDDLQWADTSTALLLGHLLQDAEPTRCSCSARSATPTARLPRSSRDLLAKLTRDPAFERIALAGLDGAETQALVSAAGRARRQRLVRRCASRRAPRATRSSSSRRCAAWPRRAASPAGCRCPRASRS